jgi:hypothetical protein
MDKIKKSSPKNTKSPKMKKIHLSQNPRGICVFFLGGGGSCGDFCHFMGAFLNFLMPILI